MNKKFYMVILGIFMVCELAVAGEKEEYAAAIQAADHKVVLEKYTEAQKDYKLAMKVASNALQKAYVHYKLGLIHKERLQPEEARAEWKKGLASLDQAGLKNHDMRHHLISALQKAGG